MSTAIGEDDSGQVKVSLWNDDIAKVNVGDQIRIRNGYSRLFRDEVHVSAGMYGTLELAGKGEEPAAAEEKPEEEAPGKPEEEAAEKAEEKPEEEAAETAEEKPEEEGEKEE